MIRVESIETAGWEPALRGMRNPLNSWERADSLFDVDGHWDDDGSASVLAWTDPVVIGPNDEALMRRLIGAGTNDHCKFRRMLKVYADVTAPLYWWSEYDTYKVATVANSCSKMHTLMDEPFTVEMFSCEDWSEITESDVYGRHIEPVPIGAMLIDFLNGQRDFYLAAKEHGDEDVAKHVWRRVIQLLPESWMQRRTVELNYEVMANIYKSRRHHKLREWRDFIDYMVENLPYPWVFTGDGC